MPDVLTAQEFPNVRVLDTTEHLCGRKVCPAVKDGIVVYGDDNHLTEATHPDGESIATSNDVLDIGDSP